MRITNQIAPWLAAALAAGSIGLSGCETQGPFEEAGEEVDEAAEEIEQEVDEEF